MQDKDEIAAIRFTNLAMTNNAPFDCTLRARFQKQVRDRQDGFFIRGWKPILQCIGSISVRGLFYAGAPSLARFIMTKK